MSAKSPEDSGLWEFGEFRLDGRARLLLRDGIPVPLTPKALEVLFYLVRHAGRAVSREELLDAIWPDTIVTDASLTQAVFLVRKALGETEASNYVETVPRIGYRFNLPDQPVPVPESESGGDGVGVGPVPEPATESPETDGTGRGRRPSPAILAVAAAGALVAAAVIPILFRSQATGGSANPVASSVSRPLLTLDREIAVPPDALRILGAFDGTVVLSAPSAFYLLPVGRGHLGVARVPGTRRGRGARRSEEDGSSSCATGGSWPVTRRKRKRPTSGPSLRTRRSPRRGASSLRAPGVFW